MPSSTKTGWAQLRVGLVAMVALAILVVLVMVMSGANPLFSKTAPAFVYLDDSFAMIPGATPVRLNGILVGKVSAVELSGDNQVNRGVRITLALDEDKLPLIPIDSTAKLAQENLLGRRYLNVKRGKSKETLQPGGEISTEGTVELEGMLEKGSSTLGVLQEILKRVERLVVEIEDGKGTIGKFLRDPALYDNLTATVNEMHDLVGTFNNPNSTLGHLIHEDGLYSEVQGTVTDVRAAVSKMDEMIAALNAGEGTAGKLLHDDGLYEDLRLAIGDMRETIRLVNHGDGTINKLLTTSTLHNRLEESMARMDAVIDKINSGEGTVGQLLNNPALYESMDGTMREMQGFMKDFRANPKKFLTIQLKLF